MQTQLVLISLYVYLIYFIDIYTFICNIQNNKIICQKMTHNNHNICDCHCGTRIDLDEQLLEERQTWKQKYHCLQKQCSTDIHNLKDQIYAQCANLMQKQFSAKETQHNKVVNAKNCEIKQLVSRVIKLESKIKVLQRQKQLLNDKVKQLEKQINIKDETIATNNSNNIKSKRELQLKYQEQIEKIKKRGKGNDQIQKLTQENQFLKQKIRQFEKKYQQLLPELIKLKSTITQKNQQIDKIGDQLDKTLRDAKKKYSDLEAQYDQINKKYKEVKDNIPKLNLHIQQLKKELQQSKKNKKEIKVEPVYIDRPIEVEKVVEKIVEVEKVVEKIVEVEKVVKHYVQSPHQKDIDKLEEENIKLIEELDSLSKHVSQIEDSIHQYEHCIKQHQENTKKYKQERQKLVKKIEQQHQQIDHLHQLLHRGKPSTGRNPDPEKIIINIKNDGTHHTTKEKIPTTNHAKTTHGKKK